MSRTYRKSRNGLKFREGRYAEGVFYKCRCEYCTGIDKKILEDKILDKEMKQECSLIG